MTYLAHNPVIFFNLLGFFLTKSLCTTPCSCMTSFLQVILKKITGEYKNIVTLKIFHPNGKPVKTTKYSFEFNPEK